MFNIWIYILCSMFTFLALLVTLLSYLNHFLAFSIWVSARSSALAIKPSPLHLKILLTSADLQTGLSFAPSTHGPLSLWSWFGELCARDVAQRGACFACFFCRFWSGFLTPPPTQSLLLSRSCNSAACLPPPSFNFVVAIFLPPICCLFELTPSSFYPPTCLTCCPFYVTCSVLKERVRLP